jgi:hypothetical protein
MLYEAEITKSTIDRWTRVFLSTDEVNRPEAEYIARHIYANSHKPQPEIVWHFSPKSIDYESLRRWEVQRGENPPYSPHFITDSKSDPRRRLPRIAEIDLLDEMQASVNSLAANMIFSDNQNLYMMMRTLASRIVFLQGMASFGATHELENTMVSINKKTAFNYSYIMSAHGMVFEEETCHIIDRPSEMHFDEDGRLHNPNGPAYLYRDGSAVYAWRNINMPKHVIEEGPRVEEIDQQNNVEIRRAMIEIYGMEKYLIDSNAKLVHSDGYGELYRKTFRNDEDLVMVKVVNSTPEPDGTYKDYFLRVPPGMETAEQAVAWTFDMDKDEYKPEVET